MRRLLQVASSDGTNTLIINALSCIHSIGFSQSPAPLQCIEGILAVPSGVKRCSNQCRKDTGSVFLASSRKGRSCRETRVTLQLPSLTNREAMVGCAQPCAGSSAAQAKPCVSRTSHVRSGRYGTLTTNHIPTTTLERPALASLKPLRPRSELLLVERSPRLEGLLCARAQRPCAYDLLVFRCMPRDFKDTRVEQPKWWRSGLEATSATCERTATLVTHIAGLVFAAPAAQPCVSSSASRRVFVLIFVDFCRSLSQHNG
jgi:hypothetical protein